MLLAAIATAIIITPESKYHPWHIYTKRNITLMEKSGPNGAAPSRKFTCIRGEICSVYLKIHYDITFLSNLTIDVNDGKKEIGFVKVQNRFFQAVPVKLGVHRFSWKFRVSTGQLVRIPFEVHVNRGIPASHMFHFQMIEPTTEQFHQKPSLLLRFVEHLADGVHENPHRFTVRAINFKNNTTRIRLFHNGVKKCNNTDINRIYVAMTGQPGRKKITKELTETMTDLFNIQSIRLVIKECHVFNPFITHAPISSTATPNTTVPASPSTLAFRILDDIETSKLIELLLIIIVVVVAAFVLLGWCLQRVFQKRSSPQATAKNFIRDNVWPAMIEMDA
ncbi:hypothetical protein GCK72_022080 [Caenorhabditis remanei]|uniref:Peptidase S72 domain-containing protein n=1 Tax=Caenorhabditis remanei TaxID=31234 RepID=A0A6A5FSV5_CAERE|nr:hypothetical protein GCK72_022080 [Caenorhabditis remanei]KAF1745633.1 hypothetical protein GCK72_022080 [Caenorhabditis remanei]